MSSSWNGPQANASESSPAEARPRLSPRLDPPAVAASRRQRALRREAVGHAKTARRAPGALPVAKEPRNELPVPPRGGPAAARAQPGEHIAKLESDRPPG